ncbi:hypothetical protein L195_g014030, partial [Trifolium pratense]
MALTRKRRKVEHRCRKHNTARRKQCAGVQRKKQRTV